MKIFTLVLLAAATSFAVVPHRFSVGTPAKADSVNENFDYLDAAVKAKANQTALDSVKAQLTSTAPLASKANQTAVDSLKQQVALKANQMGLDSTNRKLFTADSLARTKVSQADLDLRAPAGVVSTLKSTVSDHDAKISALQNATPPDLTGFPTNDALKKAISDTATKIRSWADGKYVTPAALTQGLGTKADVSALNSLSNTVGGKADSTRTIMLDANSSATLTSPINGGLNFQSSTTLNNVTYGPVTYYSAGNFNVTISARTDGKSGIDVNGSSAGPSSWSVFSTNGPTVNFHGKVIHESNDSIAGNLRVAGTIKAYTIGSSVPDYVFEPTYKLAPLTEVEAYAQEHKHLPEVPSASEIEKGGLDLTEMNLTLLKKVEELTLHAITQSKQIDAQAAQIQAQNERLRALESSRN